MNKKGLISVLFLLATVAGFLAWSSVDRAINVPEADVWFVPGMFFSVLIIIYYLSAILIRNTKVVAGLIFLSLIPSLVFANNFRHGIDVGIGFFLLVLASAAVVKELAFGVKINPYKAFKAGNFFIILAISFLISTQYFFEVKDFEVTKQIPKLPTQKISNLIVPRILSITNPEFKNMDNEKVTVDQFIVKTQEKQLANGSLIAMTDAEKDAMIDKQIKKNITMTERLAYRAEIDNQISSANKPDGASQELILTQGRKQLSEMAGTTLTGNEKISDVLAQKIDNSIAEFIAPAVNSQSDFPALPIAMATILFLSIFSLGSFLSAIWILIAGVIFGVLVRAGIVSIGKVTREVEVLE